MEYVNLWDFFSAGFAIFSALTAVFLMWSLFRKRESVEGQDYEVITTVAGDGEIILHYKVGGIMFPEKPKPMSLIGRLLA